MGFATAKLSYTGTTTKSALIISDGIHHAAISIVGSYTASNFVLGSDGHGGTQIAFKVAPLWGEI
jgi:hypothetical protein